MNQLKNMNESTVVWDRRNFYLNIFEGAAYTTGLSLISAQTVLPVLVTKFGGGNIAVGVLGVITWAGTFLPQIFASRYGETLRWKKPWVVKFGALQRLLILFIAGILLLPENSQPVMRLVLFLIFFGCNQLILGITSPIWFDFFAKLITSKKRGRSVGFRSALGGILSIGGTAFLTVVFERYTFPYNFLIIFLSAFIFEVISLILQSCMRENAPSITRQLLPIPAYFSYLRHIIRLDKHLRHFLIACIFLILSTVPIAFFTLYALKQYQLGESIIGECTFMMVCGQIFGAIAVGYIADHYSNKTALVTTAISLLCATLIALFSPTFGSYRLVFYFLGLNLGSEVLIRYNFIAEFCPVEQRSTYIGLVNTLLSPCYLVALVGGWILDALGYGTLFLIGATCSGIGILYLCFFVHEPELHRQSQSPILTVEQPPA